MLSLIRKAIVEARLLFLCCVVISFVFTWIHVLVVASIDTGSLENFLDQFDWFEKFLPVSISDLITHAGRVAVAFDHPIVMICILGFAISRGSDCVSGEIGRGTMEMLLAQPVSRLQVIGASMMVTVSGIALISLAAWAGSVCGIRYAKVTVPDEDAVLRLPLPIVDIKIPNPFVKPRKIMQPLSERVKPEFMVPAGVNLFSLGFCFAGLTMLMSSWDRYRWRTIGLVIGIFVTQVLLKITAMALKSGWIMSCTLLSGYEPQRYVMLAATGKDAWTLTHPAKDGGWVLGGLGGSLTLLGLGLLAYVIAAVIFIRRDVPAPL